MPGNRVEQLEEQVQELEATVEGLTEELVEANERIRQLEEALSAEGDEATTESEPDPHTEVTVAGDDGTSAGDEEPADEDLEKQFEVGADPEEVERAASDAVSREGEQPADTSKGGEDETDDEEEDDIIVA